MQRRSFFKLGIASAATLALAGGIAAWQMPLGLAPDGGLGPSGRLVFTSVCNAILDGSLPAQNPDRSAALDALLGRIDVLVQALPPHAQAELSQLLAVLASWPGRNALAGLPEDWAMASVAQIQQALQSMRMSSLAVRQQAYGALHDITAAAYFADAASWPILGYPGPLNI